MGQVNVPVNNRLYSVGCDDGEEAQVQRLSQVLDGRMRELAALVGQVGEARLMLMTALTLADDLETVQGEIAAMRAERSEEHTSELQSLMRISYAVFCLKKKKEQKTRQET